MHAIAMMKIRKRGRSRQGGLLSIEVMGVMITIATVNPRQMVTTLERGCFRDGALS